MESRLRRSAHSFPFEPPPYLAIHLKRFERTIQNVKNAAHVVFGAHLDVPLAAESVRFELTAVIVHRGNSVHAGHYVNYVKRNAQWYYISDEEVTLTTWHMVQSEQAYMLFYRRSPAPSPVLPPTAAAAAAPVAGADQTEVKDDAMEIDSEDGHSAPHSLSESAPPLRAERVPTHSELVAKVNALRQSERMSADLSAPMVDIDHNSADPAPSGPEMPSSPPRASPAFDSSVPLSAPPSAGVSPPAAKLRASSPRPSLSGAVPRPRIFSRHNQIMGFLHWEVTYSSQTSPGMSGGPVLLAGGSLFAVHRREGPLVDSSEDVKLLKSKFSLGKSATTAFSVGVRVDLWLLDEFTSRAHPDDAAAAAYCTAALKEVRDEQRVMIDTTGATPPEMPGLSAEMAESDIAATQATGAQSLARKLLRVLQEDGYGDLMQEALNSSTDS